jgi:hypothetical protein
MKDDKDVHAIADRIVEQSRALDEPAAKGTGGAAVVARLRLAVAPSLLHHVADEAIMATPIDDFAAGAECFLASVATTLAGYLGAQHAQFNAALLLTRAAGIVGNVPDAVFGEAMDRAHRGGPVQ